MDVATKEPGHVEMIATMVARLTQGAPATATTKADATYDGKQGEPSGPALGTETGLAAKIKGDLDKA